MKYTLPTLALITTLAATSAPAEINLTLINKTAKKIYVSLMVPRTKIFSELADGKVKAKSHRSFSLNDLMPKCAGRASWRCRTIRPTIRKWGKYVVFVQCPKIYNSRYKTQTRRFQLVGNDSSSLYCRFAPRQRRKKESF